MIFNTILIFNKTDSENNSKKSTSQEHLHRMNALHCAKWRKTFSGGAKQHLKTQFTHLLHSFSVKCFFQLAFHWNTASRNITQLLCIAKQHAKPSPIPSSTHAERKNAWRMVPFWAQHSPLIEPTKARTSGSQDCHDGLFPPRSISWKHAADDKSRAPQTNHAQAHCRTVVDNDEASFSSGFWPQSTVSSC